MGFNLGIIGLPNVGKSTIFNALTRSTKAEVANYPFATIDPNVGRVSVPDQRVNNLSKINKSLKTIPTYIDFIDIAGLVKGASEGEGLGNKFLSHIKKVDALAHVVRCFENENISHVSNLINPINDIDIINTELFLSDLEFLQKKKENLSKKIKGNDKETILIMDLIIKLIDYVEKEKNIDLNNWNEKEKKIITDLNLICAKPIFYICNVDEKSIKEGNRLSKLVKEKMLNINQVLLVSASIEAQISSFDNSEDRITLLNEFGLQEPALNRVITNGYNLLNLITFFTSGPKETRAWTIKKSSKAPEAAGKIHTDFQKGFIRAETISYEDYINYNGEAGCKLEGKLRQEGKEYIVKDGDVMNFLFNV